MFADTPWKIVHTLQNICFIREPRDHDIRYRLAKIFVEQANIVCVCVFCLFCVCSFAWWLVYDGVSLCRATEQIYFYHHIIS